MNGANLFVKQKTKDMKEFINKNLFKIITIGGILILVWLLLQQCNRNSITDKKLQIANENIAALNDSIRIVTTNNGKPEADKLSFIVDKISALAKLNADLAEEVKNTAGKVNTIIKSDVRIVHDTVPLVVHGQMIDSTVTTNFSFDKNYSVGNSRKLNGFTQYNLRNGKSNGTLNTDEIRIRFVTGIKDIDKGKPTIFLRSDYPNFKVDSLVGAEIDPNLFKPRNKQHLITLGFNVGWTPFTYDFIKQKADFSISRIGASFGANINLSRLINRKQ